jgi:hypothetical protein
MFSRVARSPLPLRQRESHDKAPVTLLRLKGARQDYRVIVPLKDGCRLAFLAVAYLENTMREDN